MPGLAAVVAVDADPVHLTPAQHFLFPDPRDVVFRLATDDAGVAADAGIDVDRHPPLVALVFEVGIQRDRAWWRFKSLVHHFRILGVLLTGGGADHAASF